MLEIYFYNSQRQKSTLSKLKRDGQKHFPLNTVILHMDFSTNVKRFGSGFFASNESRNPKESAVESFIFYSSSRSNVSDLLTFKMRTVTAVNDENKHDTHTANLNLDQVIDL